MHVASIKAYQVLDSRGEPTIRVRMESANGNHARFDAPSGSSVSHKEAVDRRDGEASYAGQGVSGNVDIITNIIAPKFIGYPLGHQADFDALIVALDGTPDLSNLGTNTLTAISGAYFLLSCYEQEKEVWQVIADLLGTTPALPRLYANMVAGGAHAPGLDAQEFIAVPQTTSAILATETVYSLYRTLRSIFQSLYGPSVQLVSDEGGMAPLGAGAEVVLEALQQFSVKSAQKFDIALDMAANHFYTPEGYQFGGQLMSMQQLGQLYMQWDQRFPLLSIEDPFAEQDLEGLKFLATQTGRKFFVAGDDFTATQSDRIRDLAAQKLIGAVVIKPNQVGTMTDMFDAIRAAQKDGVKIIISHRSGESNDTFLSDLAYGAAAFGFKLGAPMRGERVAKYNRLIEIEHDTAPAPSLAAVPAVVPGAILPPPPPPPMPAPLSPVSVSPVAPLPATPAISFNTPPLASSLHSGPPLAARVAHTLDIHEGVGPEMADEIGTSPAAAVPHQHAQAFSPVEAPHTYPMPTVSPAAPQPPPFKF